MSYSRQPNGRSARPVIRFNKPRAQNHVHLSICNDEICIYPQPIDIDKRTQKYTHISHHLFSFETPCKYYHISVQQHKRNISLYTLIV